EREVRACIGELLLRVVAGRDTHRDRAGLPGGVDVVRRVANVEDLLAVERAPGQGARTGDRLAGQLDPGIRGGAVAPEREIAVQVRAFELCVAGRFGAPGRETE